MVSTAASGVPEASPAEPLTPAQLAAEYRVVRTGAGLADRSERGKLFLGGSDAARFLQGQVTNDVVGLEPGGGCYAAFLTNKGKMLGDLRVLRTDHGLWLDCERPALQGLFNLIRRFSIGYEVELAKRTVECDLLTLAGPDALVCAGAEVLRGAREHAHAVIPLAGVSTVVARTDVGADVLVDAGAASAAVRAALVAAGAELVSTATLEALRVERGRPRYGVDLAEGEVIPQEAGLNERAVSFTKGCYVGQETVARLFYKGKPNRSLRGLRLDSPVPAGEPLWLGEREVGRLSSVVDHPVLGPIGLALIRREAGPGDQVTVGDGAARAEVVALPFG